MKRNYKTSHYYYGVMLHIYIQMLMGAVLVTAFTELWYNLPQYRYKHCCQQERQLKCQGLINWQLAWQTNINNYIHVCITVRFEDLIAVCIAWINRFSLNTWDTIRIKNILNISRCYMEQSNSLLKFHTISRWSVSKVTPNYTSLCRWLCYCNVTLSKRV